MIKRGWCLLTAVYARFEFYILGTLLTSFSTLLANRDRSLLNISHSAKLPYNIFVRIFLKSCMFELHILRSIR